ncbi:hypothetical protein AB0H42_23870 [Nocardia sp. NPDC050799]|uniref:hypothetical protein n=1 Tax=Nocardia sp. NPDC050799 TaxID=3154842 RepID=UPI0033F467E6
MNLLPSNPIALWSQLLLSELNDEDEIVRQFDYRIVPDDEVDSKQDWHPVSAQSSQDLLGRVLTDIVKTTIDGRSVRVRVQGHSCEVQR